MRIGATCVALLSYCSAFADFSLADLQKMVAELDSHLPHYKDYKYPILCEIRVTENVNASATVIPIEEGDKKWQAKMVVNTGLVEFCKGDVKLIRAVVAHELAHLSKGHPTSGQYKPGDLNALFIRQLELEADAVGAAALVAAGFDKVDMIKLLRMLDESGGDSPLMHNIGADHPTGFSRAAAVDDNPMVWRSLAEFQLGNAFMENRRFAAAAAAYDRAIVKEPKLKEAYTNKAQALLMDYYDKLPQRIKQQWFRPDFGPVIQDSPLGSRVIILEDADKNRHAKAVEAINLAATKNPDDNRVKDLKALSQVLDPDGSASTLSTGISSYESLMKNAMTDGDKLRYANNMAIGYQRTNELSKAIQIMAKTQEPITLYNPYLAMNMGAKGATQITQDIAGTAVSVIQTWLQNSSRAHSDYAAIQKNYEDLCKKYGYKVADLTPFPTYLCQATTLVIGNDEFSLFEPIRKAIDIFGPATKAFFFNETYKDVKEYIWNEQQLHILGVLNQDLGIYRVTSYGEGSKVILKPRDGALDKDYEVRVGMTKGELENILNQKGAVEVPFVRSGSLETWSYWPNLMMGVCLKDDVVVGITVSPYDWEKIPR